MPTNKKPGVYRSEQSMFSCLKWFIMAGVIFWSFIIFLCSCAYEVAMTRYQRQFPSLVTTKPKGGIIISCVPGYSCDTIEVIQTGEIILN